MGLGWNWGDGRARRWADGAGSPQGFFMFWRGQPMNGVSASSRLNGATEARQVESYAERRAVPNACTGSGPDAA